jgi:hypothetical protein
MTDEIFDVSELDLETSPVAELDDVEPTEDGDEVPTDDDKDDDEEEDDEESD